MVQIQYPHAAVYCAIVRTRVRMRPCYQGLEPSFLPDFEILLISPLSFLQRREPTIPPSIFSPLF
jgi:hypothetical protein